MKGSVYTNIILPANTVTKFDQIVICVNEVLHNNFDSETWILTSLGIQ